MGAQCAGFEKGACLAAKDARILTLVSDYTPATADRLLQGIAYNYFWFWYIQILNIFTVLILQFVESI